MGGNWCFHDWCCIKKLEKLVERLVCSYRITYHILCKSHTMERFDQSNLSVLTQKVRESVKLRDRLESVNRRLSHSSMEKRPMQKHVLLHCSACIYDKSANSCSLANEFDYVIERQGKSKHMSLYHQKRFAKLGYSAALIIAALDLLDETKNALKNCVNFDKIYLWSKVTLRCIKAINKEFKISVENRLWEIRSKTDIENWSDCPTEFHPADLIRRFEITKNFIESKLWWEGPEFLKLKKKHIFEFSIPESNLDTDVKKTKQKKHVFKFKYQKFNIQLE